MPWCIKHTAEMSRLLLPICCLLLLNPIARADQNDSALKGLFEILQSSSDTQLLMETENRIWDAWMSHPNGEVEQLMLAATQLMNSNRLSDALALYSGIIRRFPDYAEAWNKRATLYYLSGNFSASIADIDHTLALEPRHFGALSGLGLIYLRQNELRKARDAFERVLQVHPHSVSAVQNLELVSRTLQQSII